MTIIAGAVCLPGHTLHISNIRAVRKNPGLQPQHLAAVKAAASICNAHVEGAEKDSLELAFTPAKVTAGEYHFSIGTAGSTSLVLQTVLPALILADAPSSLILEGGTHNPFAPPFDFLQYAFLPLLNKMGPTVTATLQCPGFAPRGGGRIRVEVQPVNKLKPLELGKRGKIREQRAEVILAHLPVHIAQRELAVIKQGLDISDNNLLFYIKNNAYGAGNAISIIIKSEHICECFSTFGQRGVPAEQVAGKVVEEARRYLHAGVALGKYLADQILLPLAMAGSGRFITLKPTTHTLTNMDVISNFMDIYIQTEKVSSDVWKITLS